MRGFIQLRRMMPTPMLRDLWRLLGLSALVGLIAGLGAIAFYFMLDAGRFFFLESLAGYTPAPPGGEAPIFHAAKAEVVKWLLALMPAIGGLLSGLLVYSLAPEAEGHGTDAAIEAYHRKAGKIRARVPLVKAIASAITIGSGGSGGREGPIAQIGSGFGSVLASWLRLRPHDRRVLMAAGMGAGVGAIFHAPLAGALFSAEVLYKELDQEYEVIVPSVIASIIAYGVFAVKFGWNPLFITPAFSFKNPLELGPYFVLALVVAAGAVAYVKIFYGTQALFRRLPIPNHFKPMVGGMIVGLVALWLPDAIGTGYGFCQKALYGQAALGALWLVAVVKIVTTSATIGSGGSGGVFGPAVVIGASLGGGTGLLLQKLLPSLELQPGAFAIVGMAGFFAAAANTPISTIIMVSEMTGNYHLLVPSMWVCFLAYLLCKRHTIYEAQLPSRFEAPVHITDMMEAILKNLSVAQVLKNRHRTKVVSVRPDTNLHELAELFETSHYASFPIVDEQGHAVAMVSGRELRAIVAREELDKLVVAMDLAHPLVKVTPEANLYQVVMTMAETGEEEICVVDPKQQDRVIDMLSRADVISAYHAALTRGPDALMEAPPADRSD